MAQTGQVMPPPKFTAYDANGDPCNGCKLFVYEAGTTTKTDTYTTSGLSVANANPVVLDSAGRATVFLSPSVSYKFVLAPASDTDPPAAPIWTVDSVVGPFSGVVAVTAANTRGIQISRSGADAGMSIASTGGSGKTYGITSNTAGALRIQDDSDGTPRIELSGNDVSTTLTGTFTVGGGLVAVTGLGVHAFDATGAGNNTLRVRNSTAGTANYANLLLGTDTSSSAAGFAAFSSTFTTAAPNYADGATVNAAAAGGLSLSAGHASGDVRIYTGGSSTARLTIDQDGRITAAAQPAFSAYNSGNDSPGVISQDPIEFDTEVYDIGGHFNNSTDVFTAPVTGIYTLCAAVEYLQSTTNQVGSVWIETSNRTYTIGKHFQATSQRIRLGGCVDADMDANDTAKVAMNLDAGTITTIYGAAVSNLATYFSGRLVQ